MTAFNVHDHLLRRDHTLHGGIVVGIDGVTIDVQARATEVFRGKPRAFHEACRVSGMARSSVHEALDRISGAFSKLGIRNSPVQILINLAPAAIEKGGSWLDLPLALVMLQAAGYLPDLPENKERSFLLFGEVGIHGELRRVPGALSLAFAAKQGQSVIVPHGNEKECALILAKPGHEGCGVYPAKTLDEVIWFFRGEATLPNALRETIRFEPVIPKCLDYGRIRGQSAAKRAAEICAAGGHNLLLLGPPGEGKSLIASALPGILPPLDDTAKVEVTKIYSACGLLEMDGQAVTRRPFRTVHHSVSMPALIGGGSGIPKPGEVTLAHQGIMFLDELPEFSRQALESLRQPIENGSVTVTRVGASLTFPARFTLVAAMNPCPCGYAGTDRCECSPSEVRKYQRKLSGPLLDRIDLQVSLEALSTDDRFAPTNDDESQRLRQKVVKARMRQQHRYAATQITHNAAIPGGSIGDYCQFSGDGFNRFKDVIARDIVSTRTTDRLAKVARTIADLADQEFIETAHIEEAALYVKGGVLGAKES